MIKIYFNLATTERRVAIVENNEVVEILIERPVENRLVGNIYKARVVNVLPGMEAAFVDIGREKNGFIYRDDLLSFQLSNEEDSIKKQKKISQYISQGEEIFVQVTKEAFGTKGPRLSGVISFPGKYLVYMPEGGYIGVSRKIQNEEERERLKKIGEKLTVGNEGLIIRTVSTNITEEEIAHEIDVLRKLWQDILEQSKEKKTPALIYQDNGIVERIIRDFPLNRVSEIVIDHIDDYKKLQQLLKIYPKELEKVKLYQEKENIFSAYGIEKELEKALRRQVWLKNGAYLMIDRTEALTVIDVNTGKFTGRNDIRETIVKTNVEAAKEIGRQLRLRDISGIIIIDFIDMKTDEDKQTVLQALKKALESDRTKTNVVGLTGLGLVELTRKKIRQNLTDSLSTQCSECNGKAVVLSNEAQAYRIERHLYEYRNMDNEALVVEVHPDVAKILYEIKVELEQKVNYKIYILENSLLKQKQYLIPYIGTKEEAEKRVKK